MGSGHAGWDWRPLKEVRCVSAWGFLGVCAGVIALGVVAQSVSAQTLAAVKKRGQVSCGVNGNLPPFSSVNEKKERVGFDADFCRAVAAAVLGDATKVNYIALPIAKRFDALKSGEIDVLARHSAITMERTAGAGVRGAAVTYIDGQAFVVPRRINVASLTGLDKKTLCVTKDEPHQNAAESWMSLRGLSVTSTAFDNQDAMYEAFFAGKCDAVTQEATIVATTIIATGKAGRLPDAARDHLERAARPLREVGRRPMVRHRALDLQRDDPGRGIRGHLDQRRRPAQLQGSDDPPSAGRRLPATARCWASTRAGPTT